MTPDELTNNLVSGNIFLNFFVTKSILLRVHLQNQEPPTFWTRPKAQMVLVPEISLVHLDWDFTVVSSSPTKSMLRHWRPSQRRTRILSNMSSVLRRMIAPSKFSLILVVIPSVVGRKLLSC